MEDLPDLAKHKAKNKTKQKRQKNPKTYKERLF